MGWFCFCSRWICYDSTTLLNASSREGYGTRMKQIYFITWIQCIDRSMTPSVFENCKSTLSCTSRPRHIWCHQSLQSNDVVTGRNKKSLNTASSQNHPMITVSHIVSTTLSHRLGGRRNYIQLQPNNSLYA